MKGAGTDYNGAESPGKETASGAHLLGLPQVASVSLAGTGPVPSQSDLRHEAVWRC